MRGGSPRWSSSEYSESSSEDEEPHQENNSMGGSSIVSRMVIATAVAVFVITVAWEGQEEDRPMGDASAIAIVVAGTVIAAWVNSRVLISNELNQQRVRSAPSRGRYKMNTDGSCRPTFQIDGVQRGPSGYGGILRDHEGNWVRGFVGFIGESNGTTNYQERNRQLMEPQLVNTTRIEPAGGSRPRSIWSPPPPGQFKLNTDGACCPGYLSQDGHVKRGPSGFGGILRDHRGEWVRGFIGFIGDSDSLTSELHGVLKGLELLDKLNLTGAILETDCEAAFKWINKPDTINKPDPKSSKKGIIVDSSDMILECRRLVAKNNIEMKHIPEQANKCADKLSKMAIDRKRRYTVIRHLPPELRNLVENEKAATRSVY